MPPVAPSIAAGVSLIAAGVIAAIPAVSSLPGVATPEVQLTAGEDTSDTLTSLLNTASTNYADAYNLANSMFTEKLVPAVSPAQDSLDANDAAIFSNTELQIVDSFSTVQPMFASHYFGALSGLVDQLLFAPLDQQEVSFSEELLHATQALDSALEAYDAAATPSNTFALDAAELSFDAVSLEWTALQSHQNFAEGVVSTISFFDNVVNLL